LKFPSQAIVLKNQPSVRRAGLEAPLGALAQPKPEAGASSLIDFFGILATYPTYATHMLDAT
jgi:hypothetical protein